MQLSFFLLADYAATDASRKLTIVGVFTTIHASAFPHGQPASIVLQLKPEAHDFDVDHKLRITFVDSDGREQFGWDSTLLVPRPSSLWPPTDVNITLRGIILPLAAEGDYKLLAFLDGDLLGEAPVYVYRRG